MPIYNSNSLQSNIDFKQLSTYSDNFLVEALANLGQRMGVKGDNVTYTYFTCKELFYNHILSQTNIIDDNGYIALFYKNNLAHAYYISANKLKESKNGYYKQTDILDSNLVKIENDIISNAQKTMTFDNNTFLYNINLFDNKEIVLNNIETYLTPSRIYLEGDYMYTELFGKLIGTAIQDNNNIEYQYNIFNIKSNTLEKNIRLFYLYTDNNINYYCYIKCEKHKTKRNQYTLDIKVISEDDIKLNNEILVSSINRFFTYSNIENDYELSLKSPDNNLFYSQYQELIEILDNKSFNPIFSTSIYNQFLQYNSDSDVLFSFNTNNDDNLKIASENLNNKILTYQNYSIDTYLRYLNNDMVYLYPNLLKIFSQTVFTENKSQLILKILYAIYENCLSYNNSINQNNYINKYPVLYIPLNYKFYYFCNSNNPLEIYYSNRFNIQYINLDGFTKNEIQKYIFNYDNKSKQIVCDYIGENIIKEYNFNAEYNDKYQDIIIKLNIVNTFTYPYINAINTWTVNDIETDVIAKYTETNTKLALFVYNISQNNTSFNLSDYEFINIDESIFNINEEVSSYEYLDINNNLRRLYAPINLSITAGNYQIASQIILAGCQKYITADNTTDIVYFLYTYNKDSNSFNILLDKNGYVFLLNNLLNINQLTTYIRETLNNYEIYKNIVFEIDNNSQSNSNSYYNLTYKEKYKLPVDTNTNQYIFKDKKDITKEDKLDNNNNYLITHNFSNIKTYTTQKLLDKIKNQQYINLGSSNWITSSKDKDNNLFKFNTISISNLIYNTTKTKLNNDILFNNTNTYSTNINSGVTISVLNTNGTENPIKETEETISTEVYKEAVPLNIILTNLEDLLLKDAKFINRLNIIGSDQDKYLYNTSLSLRLFDLEDSTSVFYPELLLTSNKYNFSGGYRNLFNDKGQFKEVDALRISFNNTYIDSIEWKTLGNNKYITNYYQLFNSSEFAEYNYPYNEYTATQFFEYANCISNIFGRYTIKYTTIDIENQYSKSINQQNTIEIKNIQEDIQKINNALKLPLYYLTYYATTTNNSEEQKEYYWKFSEGNTSKPNITYINPTDTTYNIVTDYMTQLEFKYVLNLNLYIENIINYLHLTQDILSQVQCICIKYKDNIYKFKHIIDEFTDNKSHFELEESKLFNYNHFTYNHFTSNYTTIEAYIFNYLYPATDPTQTKDELNQIREEIKDQIDTELPKILNDQHLIFNRFSRTAYKTVYNVFKDKNGVTYNFSPLLIIDPKNDLIYNGDSLYNSDFIQFKNEDIKIYKDMNTYKDTNKQHTNPYYNIIINL